MIRLSRKLILPAALLAALIQSAAVGKMVIDRNTLLRNGQEVRLETGFVDPRDIFRGHYVTLRLEISQFPQDSVETLGDPLIRDPVWIELSEGDDGFWQPVRLYTAQPDAPAGPLLRGELLGMYNDAYTIRYPVDRYFAPELLAKELEQFRRDDKLGVILALSPDGQAAIKGLTVAGETVYVEPLY